MTKCTKFKAYTTIDQSNVPPRLRIRPTLLRETVRQALRQNEMSGSFEVDIIITTDKKIRALNKQYRQVDAPTDVLSFPILDEASLPVECTHGHILLGDIIISIDTARRQAAEDGVTVDQMIAWLLSHGMLHLMGVNHDTEELRAAMNEREKAILAKLGMPARIAKLYNEH